MYHQDSSVEDTAQSSHSSTIHRTCWSSFTNPTMYPANLQAPLHNQPHGVHRPTNKPICTTDHGGLSIPAMDPSD